MLSYIFGLGIYECGGAFSSITHRSLHKLIKCDANFAQKKKKKKKKRLQPCNGILRMQGCSSVPQGCGYHGAIFRLALNIRRPALYGMLGRGAFSFLCSLHTVFSTQQIHLIRTQVGTWPPADPGLAALPTRQYSLVTTTHKSLLCFLVKTLESGKAPTLVY